MRRSIGGESTLASTSRPAGALPASGLPRTAMPRAASAASSLPAANAGGLVWKALPASLAKPRLKESALSGPTQIDTP
jgi:hypothetical protein